MNKKAAWMIHALLSLLVGIIVIVPAVTFASSVLRVSYQGQESFEEVIKIIKEISSGEEKEKSLMLKMDQGTVIVGFDQGVKRVEGCQSPTSGKKVCRYFPKPKVSDCQTEACICLIKSILNSPRPKMGVVTNVVTYEDVDCWKVGKIKFKTQKETRIYQTNSISIDPDPNERLKDVTSKSKFTYLLNGGFIISREINPLKVYPFSVFPQSFNLETRRKTVYFGKEGNQISVCLDKDCQEIKLLVKSTQGKTESSRIK